MWEVFPFSFSHLFPVIFVYVIVEPVRIFYTVFKFKVTCSLTDVAVSLSSAHVLDLDCFTTNVIPLPVFSPQFDGGTVLDSTPVVGFSRSPVGEVKRSAEVVPHPRPIMEDVRQPNPEAKVSVSIPSPTGDFPQDGILLLLRIDLNQIAAALPALSS